MSSSLNISFLGLLVGGFVLLLLIGAVAFLVARAMGK